MHACATVCAAQAVCSLCLRLPGGPCCLVFAWLCCCCVRRRPCSCRCPPRDGTVTARCSVLRACTARTTRAGAATRNEQSHTTRRQQQAQRSGTSNTVGAIDPLVRVGCAARGTAPVPPVPSVPACGRCCRCVQRCMRAPQGARCVREAQSDRFECVSCARQGRSRGTSSDASGPLASAACGATGHTCC